MNWRIAVVAGLTLFGLYLGSGGVAATELLRLNEWIRNRPEEEIGPEVEYEGVPFLDQALVEFVVARDRNEFIWPWLVLIPTPAYLMVAAVGFGAVGGGVHLLKKRAIDGKPWKDLPIVAMPLLTSFLALILLAASYVLPLALTTGEGMELPSSSVVVVSLFAGLFPERAYKWVESQANKVFSQESQGTRT